MPKQINVGIRFDADVSSAKKNIQDLNKALQNLTNVNTFDVNTKNIDTQLSEGAKAAAELQLHLEHAINTDTGKLDLVKFADSLKQSETNLEHFQTKLAAMGPDGRKTFLQLAQVIGEAEIPTLRLNKALQGV